MNPDNDWYGHKRVLADYCGMSSARPIYGYIPHGWYFDVPDVVGERRFSSAPYFAWNQRHSDQLHSLGVPNVHCIGAPFVYLYAHKYNECVPDGRGTIFFPTHSAEGTKTENRHLELIKTIESAFPPPYSVSIYYQDLDDPAFQAYRDRGWRVVSFGSRSNTYFLHQQITELAAHSHVVANSPQTALWYGALLARGIAIINRSSTFLSIGRDHSEQVLRESTQTSFQKTRLAYPRLFDGGMSGSEAFEVGAIELGYSFKLSPNELRESLGWSSRKRSLLALSIGLLIDLRDGKKARRGDLSR